MKPEVRAALIAFVVALASTFVLDAIRERSEAQRAKEQEIRRIAIDVACRTLVEAGLLTSCGERDQSPTWEDSL